MSGAEIDAARHWLERFVGIYAGADAEEGDPVYAVRAHAGEMLVIGPTPDDPFTICREIADVLPQDRQAENLCDAWREELELARKLDADGP